MTKKVLVLDDDEAVLEVLEAALQYANFDVRIADESSDILKDIEAFNPDVVLIDYLLRGINGGELCHQIKNNSKTAKLPVILISAYPRVLLSLGDYGCNAFMAKPFDLSDLIFQINSCITSESPDRLQNL